jgi:hypothetical protein
MIGIFIGIRTEQVIVYALGAEDEKAEEHRWLFDLHECPAYAKGKITRW